MNIKKRNILLIFLFLVVVLSLGSVAATDDVANTIDTNSADNNDIQLAIENNSTNDTQDNSSIINVDEKTNSELLATSTVNLQTTNDAGNFTELQTAINGKLAGETLVLTKNYIRLASDSDLTISKAITIDANGFTISGNNLGGIFQVAKNGDLTLKNAILIQGIGIEYTSNLNYGGAIFSKGKVSIYDSTFKDNTAHTGGVIYKEGGAGFTIVNSTFTDNTAHTCAVIYNEGGAGFTVVNSSFTGNTATYASGAIWNYGGAGFSVVNSSFTGNTAQFYGAILNNGAGFSVVNSSFTGNTAEISAGAIFNNGNVDFKIVNSTFIGNTAKKYGGAIFNSGIFTVSNSTFINTNEIIFNSGGELFIENITANKNSYINNNGGTITSPVVINVLNNETLIVNRTDKLTIFGNISACGISVRGTNLTFIVNDETINSSWKSASNRFEAIYTVNLGGNKTVTAAYTGANDTYILNATMNVNVGNFTELQALIDKTSAGKTLTLCNYYTRVAGDSDLVINQAIIIDANGFTINGNDLGGIFNVTTTGDLTLKNAILIKGTGILDGSYICGGAIYSKGKLSIYTSTFTGNTAEYGGAIYNSGDNFTIVNSTFTGNTAEYGGAIYNIGDNFTITNSTYTGNNATKSGGAISNSGADFIIVNSTCTGNNATKNGGAIYNAGSSFTIVNSICIGNNADTSGAIDNNGINFKILNSTFINNTATVTSGAIYNKKAGFTIVNSSFIGNNASSCGAIFNNGINFKIVNSTFTGNTAEYGGAIWNNYGATSFTVVNSTFTGNTATYTTGGVIYNRGAVTISNSTFINNSNEIIYNEGGELFIENITADTEDYINNDGGKITSPVVINVLNNETVNVNMGDNVTIFGNITASGISVRGTALNFIVNNETITGKWNSSSNRFESIYTVNFVGNKTVTATYTGATNASILNGTINCESKENSFTVLQVLIDVTSAGETLVLTQNYTRVTGDSDLTIDKAITIDAQGFTISGNNLGGIFNVTSTGNLTLINAILIKGIGVKMGYYHKNGGAICSDGKVSIYNSTFTNNTATFGGAIYNTGAGFTIVNSIFTNNTVTRSGGAIFNEGAGFTIVNSTFIGNNATDYAGAIFNKGNGSKIINSTFTNNRATDQAGAIENYECVNFAIRNSTFINNTAKSGGAIFNDCADVTISNSTFINTNEIIYNKGELFVENITADDNYITNKGKITSPVVINVLNNKTVSVNKEDNVTIFGTIAADDIPVHSTNLTFIVNDEQIIGSWNSSSNRFEAIYTVNFVGKQTVTANYAGANDIYVLNGTIDVKAGNFTELQVLINDNYGKTLVLDNNYTKVANDPDLIINKSIIIDANGFTINGNKIGGIFKITGTGDLTLNNAILINGIGVNYYSDICGGAIFSEGKLSICNSTFKDNAAEYGGAIYNTGANCTIVNSTFIANNATTNSGGAIWNNGVGFTIVNSSFIGNNAESGGGAIYNEGAAGFTVVNSTFNYNTASEGGAFETYYAKNCTISNSTFTNNTAEYGSAIWICGIFYDNYADVAVYNSTFINNSNEIIYNKGELLLENITADENSYITNKGIIISPVIISVLNNGTVNVNKGDNVTIFGNVTAEGISVRGTNLAFIVNGETIHSRWNSSSNRFEAIYTVNFAGNKTVTATYTGANNTSILNGTINVKAGNFTELQALINDNYGKTLVLDNNYTRVANDTDLTINQDITIDANGFTINGNKLGGIFFVASTGDLTLINAILIKGTGVNYYGDICGGAICSDGKVSIYNSTFKDNSANMYGGVIFSSYVVGASFTVVNSTFKDNTACWAGAIYNDGVGSKILNSTFIGNNATDYGGAIFNYGGAGFIISNSTFTNNTAINEGGAIENFGGAVTLSNSTFSGNTAKYGDAIWISGAGTVSNSTFINTDEIIYNKGKLLLENITACADVYITNKGTIISPVVISVLNNGTVSVNRTDKMTLFGTITADDIPVHSTNLTFIVNDEQVTGSWNSSSNRFEAIYTAYFVGNKTVNANYAGATNTSILTGTINSKGLGTFTELQALINDNYGKTLVLYNNYTKVANDSDLTINQDIIIDANGFTINGNNLGGIFNVADTGDLTLNNAVLIKGTGVVESFGYISGGAIFSEGKVNINNSTFKDNTAEYGGAIYNEGVALKILNSTFKDNTAESGGGAIYNYYADNFTVINSTFTNNTASEYGGAIENFKCTNSTISNSTFINNTSPSGAIFNDCADVTISNSTFINNSNEIIYNKGELFIENITVNAGAYITNNGTITSPVVINVLNNETVNVNMGDNVTIFGNITADDIPVRGINLNFIINNHQIKGSWNSSSNRFEAIFTVNFVGNKTVNATYSATNASILTGTINSKGLGTFTELQALINDNYGTTLTLYNNYTRVAGDSDLIIDKAITIEANGFTISGNNLGGIFNVADTGDLTLNNAVLIKGTGVVESFGYISGGAIFSEGKVNINNSTFKDNTAEYGGAIYNEGVALKILNSTFKDNTAESGGAIYNYYADNFTVINSTFKDNTANKEGGAIENFKCTNSTISNSTFINNTSPSGAIFNDCADVTISNSTFINNSNEIIYNKGELFIEDITVNAGAYITNNGTITSPVVINVLNNETVVVNKGDNVTIFGNITAVGISVRGTDLTFIVNDQQIKGSWNSSSNRFEAIYTVDFVGKQTVTATYTGANNTSILNATINSKGIISNFTELQELINKTSAGETLVLTKDYTRVANDPDLIINKAITINANGFTINGNNLGGIFKITGTGDLTLNNAILINGIGVNYYNDICGGAIFSEGKLSICNSTFKDNAAEYGGVIYNTGANCTIVNSTFIANNATTNSGGAIWNNGVGFTIVNSSFIGNNATSGGAIYNEGATGFTVVNSTFNYNTASEGGAFETYYAKNCTISNSTFTNNTAEYGSAIWICGIFYDDYADVAVYNSTFINNSNEIIYNKGELLLENITADENAYITNKGTIISPVLITVLNNGTVSVNRTDKVTIFGNVTADDIPVRGTNLAFIVNGETIHSRWNSSSNRFEAIYTVDFAGNKTVTATYTGANNTSILNATINSKGVGNFTELQALIDGTIAGETLVLDNSYTRVTGDSDLVINKAIIIDANGFTINGNKLGGIFNVTSTGDLTLRNANLINGTGFIYQNEKYGGAIFSYGKVSIYNSAFTDNTAEFGGGAICNSGAGFIVVNSTFTNNTAGNIGGAIGNTGAGFTVVNSTFINNNAIYIGAIYNEGVNATILNSTFIGNNATYVGVIYTKFVSFNVVNSTFINNTAAKEGIMQNCGGINCTIVNSTFTDNSCDSVILTNGTVTVSNSIFINNSNEIIHNEGELFIENITADADAYINNTGNITSTVVISVLNNGTVSVNRGDKVTIFGNITAGGILVRGTNLNFIVNNETMTGSWNSSSNRFEASYTVDFVGSQTVTANYASATNVSILNGTICSKGVGTFTELEALINKTSAGETLVLDYNYTRVANDPDLVIDKAIIIDANGFTINGNNLGGIFNVTSTADLTLKNAILIKGISIIDSFGYKSGGAIYSEGKVSIYNSTFTGNTADFGGAVFNGGDGFTIVNSTFTGNNATESGGAIYNNGVNCTVIDSTFKDNTAKYGGAIINVGVGFIIVNSTFTNNNVTYSGGAIGNKGDGFTILNSTFTGNNAIGCGAIFNQNGVNFFITNSTFKDNTATWGGAIFNYDGVNCTVVNSTFTNNNATNDAGGAIGNMGAGFTVVNSTFVGSTAEYGGAIWNAGDNFTIVDSPFVGSTAEYGGVIYNKGDNFTIVDSSFTGSTAEYGGAIWNAGDNFTISNSTFVGNTADARGGVLYSINGTVYISDSTFAGNNASVYGGAIHLDSDNVSSAVILNCNFSNNVAGTDGGAIFSFITVDIENSAFDNNVVNASNGGGAIYILANGSLVNNCSFINNHALLHGGAIYLDANNAVITNSKFYNNTAGEYGGAIIVYGNDNLISGCDFVNNDAPNGTVVGVYKGYNLAIVDCSNFNNKSSSAEIYLDTNETSLANVKVVVLGNSTIYADYLDTINLTAVVTCDSLTVSGGNLTFNDSYNVYTATDLGNGTYIAEYIVDYSNIRVIGAQFANAVNSTVCTAVIDSTGINLTVADVVMYYKGGKIVASLFAKGQPLVGETIAMTINGATYNLITDDEGIASLPIGLSAGNYSIYTIYNLTYRYVDANSTLTVLPTITGENLSLYYRNGSSYAVKVVDTLGQAAVNQVVRMNINGVFYDRVTDSSGYAYLPIGLVAGNYIITAENLANGEMTSNTIVVLPTLVGEDVSVYHRNGSGYSVKVLNKDGSVAAFANVRMNINGVFYTVTADEKGIAFLPIGLDAGKYIITTEYDGFMTSNIITVLPVLIGEDISLSYRDGTNYTVQVLDGQGSPLAGVTVTMNINGIFYDRITNGSGVANLPIGLLPGQYIITTTYADHITSNIITVLPELLSTKAVFPGLFAKAAD